MSLLSGIGLARIIMIKIELNLCGDFVTNTWDQKDKVFRDIRSNLDFIILPVVYGFVNNTTPIPITMRDLVIQRIRCYWWKDESKH